MLIVDSFSSVSPAKQRQFDSFNLSNSLQSIGNVLRLITFSCYTVHTAHKISVKYLFNKSDYGLGPAAFPSCRSTSSDLWAVLLQNRSYPQELVKLHQRDSHQTWAGYRLIPSSVACVLCELHIVNTVNFLPDRKKKKLLKWGFLPISWFLSHTATLHTSHEYCMGIYGCVPVQHTHSLILIKCNSHSWPVTCELCAVWLQLVMCLES